VKFHGKVVADRTFDLKRDANSWEARQKLKLTNGDWVDPRLGEETFGSVIERFLNQREGTISESGYATEVSIIRTHIFDPANPKAYHRLANMPVASIDVNDIRELLKRRLREGANFTSVVRFRTVLSVIFSWAVNEEKIITVNPVREAKMPAGIETKSPRLINPFSKDELLALHKTMNAESGGQADLVLVLGLTGLRWGELTPLLVRDVLDLPYPALKVTKSRPDGFSTRNMTKGDSRSTMPLRVGRRVPLEDELKDIFKRARLGKSPDDLLFTTESGAPLNARNWERKVKWRERSDGRRIHDLRHTAASYWLNKGLDTKTVQTWLGHKTMSMTADLYGHFLGSDADRAGLARLNKSSGDAAGTRKNVRSSKGNGGR
jgi:integrase